MAYEAAKKSMANSLIYFQDIDKDDEREEANNCLAKMDLFAPKNINEKYADLFGKIYATRKYLENTEGFKDKYLTALSGYENEYNELLALMKKDLGIKDK